MAMLSNQRVAIQFHHHRWLEPPKHRSQALWQRQEPHHLRCPATGRDRRPGQRRPKWRRDDLWGRFWGILDSDEENPWIYHLVNIQKAIENGPVEIVDFPINSMVIFHSYVAVYQRVLINLWTSWFCWVLSDESAVLQKCSRYHLRNNSKTGQVFDVRIILGPDKP